MSDLVGNPEDRFSRVAAHIKVGYKGVYIAWICFPDENQNSIQASILIQVNYNVSLYSVT